MPNSTYLARLENLARESNWGLDRVTRVTLEMRWGLNTATKALRDANEGLAGTSRMVELAFRLL